MSFMAKNPLSVPEVEHTPSTPPGTRGIFAKKDGWYSIDGKGKVTKIATHDDIKNISIDTKMSDTSENPVQNKVVKKYVDDNVPTKISDLEDDTSFGMGITVQCAEFASKTITGEYIMGASDIEAKVYTTVENAAQRIKSQLEDGTIVAAEAKNAEYAGGAGHATHSTGADMAFMDMEGNDIPTTYAKKPTISTLEDTTYTFDFSDNYNKDVRCHSVDSISIIFQDDEYAPDYISGLSFNSGETPTAFDYTDSGIINWVGTDCTKDGDVSIFQPSANTHYDIVFYFNGMQFIGLVNGFVPASGNVVSK